MKPFNFREARMAIALVTGASSGIGLATGATLARGGYKVTATMRNLDGAAELQKIVSAENFPAVPLQNSYFCILSLYLAS
jgi:NAD(P)-dependent dehydrogenase (short-subunit alcohol dehydrogenase family)